MAKYYGIGGWWKNTRGFVVEDFSSKKRACISAHTSPTKTERRMGFHKTFLDIKKGDTIYLKSFFRLRNKKRIVRIKSVGMVTCTKDNNKIIAFEDKTTGYCIKVEWYRYDFEGLHDIDLDSLHDTINRNVRVYQETNPEVIRIINRLLQ